MVGPVMTSAPRANDLHGFLAKANLERFYYRLEHELKLDSVSRLQELHDFTELVEMGMTKKDIGNLRKQLKKEDHPSGTFSLLRTKSKPVKSVSAVAQNPPSTSRTTQPTTKLNVGNQPEPAKGGKFPSCEQSGGSCAKRGTCLRQESCGNRCQTIAKDNNSGTKEKRGALKRSMSAATDHMPSCHPLNRVQSTAHPHCMNGQRLALWHHEKDNSEFSKRFSLRTDDLHQKMQSGKSHTENKESESISAMTEVLTVLGGPSTCSRPEASNPPTLTDRSPLIELDKPCFGNSFDNVAATDNGSISRNSSEGGLPGQADGEPVQAALKLAAAGARHSEGKRRKWFPQLRVKIPENDNVTLSPKLNIKKLTAAEERKIDEALELAGTFARLGTSEHFASTPRTPGASSKESKESLSSSTESPTSHFRFGLFKMRKEEKKTFVEELASHLTDPSSLLTPEALDAYEKLVSKSGLDKDDSGYVKSRPAKQSARQAHRLSLRLKLFRQVHLQRSSLSESDNSASAEGKLPENVTGHNRSMRFGSTGRTLKNPSDKQNLFVWFDKSPLNSSMKEEGNSRPRSLQSSFHVDARVNKFPLSMPAQNASVCMPVEAAAPKMAGTRRSPPPPPVDEFCPPPAVPPRVPLRQSTVNTKPRQRHYPLPSGTPDKKRCYSEGMTFPDGARLNLARREVLSTSTDDGHSLSSEPHLTTGLNQLNSTHGSNDSVFDHRSPGSNTSQGVSSGVAGSLGQYRSLSVNDGKITVEQLAISDKNDPFWIKSTTLDLSECHSESDLLREALTPIPGRYETSDCISYEDLMEFALENRGNDVCDEIRVMRKMFSNDVTVGDCMDALVKTSWDIHSAVKLIRLKELLSTGLGTQDQCKEALMASNWNVDEAASFLLASSSE